MPSLLSGSMLRRGGSGEFIDLPGSQPQLPATDTTTTGYTLITNSFLQTRYASSLGNIEFNQARIYSSLPDGVIRVLSTGTVSESNGIDSGTLVVEGGVGIGRNLWVNEDIHVNGLTIGQGFEGINNIIIRGTATTQVSEFSDGQESIAIGYDTLNGISTAYKSIAIGRFALSSGTEIRNNIAIGDSALTLVGVFANLNGGNVAIGSDSGKNLIDGENNVFLGYNAAPNWTTGSNNIIIGHETAQYVYTGSGIISIGGDNIVSGNDNQVNIGSVFYFDGDGYATINAETTIGLGTDSTGTSSGALMVVGGVGIIGNINIGGDATTIGVVNINSTGTSIFASIIDITNPTEATDSNTGALHVAGGVGISGDLFVNGQLYVTGPEDITLSPQAASVYIQPTAAGTVEIYPNAQGKLDNMVIGGDMAADATFNTADANIFHATSTETSISTVSNQSIVSDGGIGVMKDIYAVGNVYSAGGIVDEGNLLYTPRATVTAGTPPDTPRIGDIWIDATIPAYLQYIKDGTSTFWIQVGAV